MASLLIIFALGLVLGDGNRQASQFVAAGLFDQLPTTTVAFGPLQIPVSPKSGSFCGLCALALLLHAGTIKSLLFKKRDEPSSTSTNQSLAVAQLSDIEQSAEATATSSNEVRVNNFVNLAGLSPSSDPVTNRDAEYYSAGVQSGSRYTFSVVIRQNVSKHTSEAKGILASLAEEQHATRYRNSKLSALSDFCESLLAGIEEPWFQQACQMYDDCFQEKLEVFTDAHQQVENQRQRLRHAAAEYEKTTKERSLSETETEAFETRFREIYDRVIDVLDDFVNKLRSLNARCAAENSMEAAARELVNCRNRIENRMDS